MCGLAGHSGILDNRARVVLTRELSLGIDHRGGHAAGFVSLSRSRLRTGRVATTWAKAPGQFHGEAASGSIMTLLHSRFATCGLRTAEDAHPFKIVRDNRTIYGAHNGVIDNADESAAANGRTIRVDSQELFELLADDDLDGFRKLSGYGAITWIDAADPSRVYLCRISEMGDLEAYAIKGGGIVWGSTDSIIKTAIRAAGLDYTSTFDLKCGQVYEVANGRISVSERPGFSDLTISAYGWGYGSSSYVGSRGWNYSGDECENEYDREFWGRWAAEQNGESIGSELDRIAGKLERDEELSDAELDLAWDLAMARDDDSDDDESDESDGSNDLPDATGPELWRALARQEARERRERKQWERTKRAITASTTASNHVGRERYRVRDAVRGAVDVDTGRNYSRAAGSK